MAEREKEQDTQDTTADEHAEHPEGRDAPAPARPAERERPSLDEALSRLDRLEKQLAASNKNAAAARRRAEELEAEESRRQEAKLSEDERVKRQLKEESSKRADAEAAAAEAKALLRRARINQAVEREAAKSYADRPEFLEPDIVPQLVDPTAIDIDEDDRLTGVKEAVKKLATERPSLLRPKPQGGTPVRDSRGGGTRAAAGASVDEIKQQLLARQGNSYGSL